MTASWAHSPDKRPTMDASYCMLKMIENGFAPEDETVLRRELDMLQKLARQIADETARSLGHAEIPAGLSKDGSSYFNNSFVKHSDSAILGSPRTAPNGASYNSNSQPRSPFKPLMEMSSAEVADILARKEIHEDIVTSLRKEKITGIDLVRNLDGVVEQLREDLSNIRPLQLTRFTTAVNELKSRGE